MIKCKICLNEEDNKHFIAREMMFGTKDTFNYLECTKCGCVQILDIPINISKYYPKNYYSLISRQTNNSFFKKIKEYLKTKRDLYLFNYAVFNRGILGKMLYSRTPYERIEIFRALSFLPVVNKQSRLLDVGSGSGEFLSGLKRLKFNNLLGIDPYLDKEIFIDKNFKIIKKDLMQLDGKFDIIMLSHSFEHMADPKIVIRKLESLTAMNGYCIIRIPLADSFAYKHYGANWVELDAPRHFFLHTKASMNLLLANSTLKISQIIYDSTDFQFWASEQYEKDIPLFSNLSYAINQKLNFSKTTIAKFKNDTKLLNNNNRGSRATFILQNS